MPAKVFWSWQSDRPGSVSRHFLKGVLERVLVSVGEELGLQESERPGLDHDTKDEAGMVSIPDSILAKIEGAAVFIGDLTPVAQSERGRWIANPNVLIELGYAKKALGPSQIVLIWNDAWGGCSPNDLPFDLRHRRGPITYSLPEGASREERERAERSLAAPLTAAIAACLRRVPATEPEQVTWPDWQRARGDDPSVWFDADATVNVNAGTFYGADRVSFSEAPRSYVRTLPRDWPSGTRAEVARGGSFQLSPLGDRMGLSWGPTRGGLIAYHVQERDEGKVSCDTATQWFASTGETWGFDSGVVFEADGGKRTLATVYVVECWARYLRRLASFYSYHGVAGPFRVQIGLTQLEGVHWPKQGLFQDTQLGLEPSMQVVVELEDLSENSRFKALLTAHTGMLDAFGLPANEDELRKMLRETRRP